MTGKVEWCHISRKSEGDAYLSGDGPTPGEMTHLPLHIPHHHLPSPNDVILSRDKCPLCTQQRLHSQWRHMPSVNTHTLTFIVWRREMEMRDTQYLIMEMVHLPLDMHLPTHPTVKNDENFFHCREMEMRDMRHLPTHMHIPGLSQAKNRKFSF
jgi:hypothetical protein